MVNKQEKKAFDNTPAQDKVLWREEGYGCKLKLQKKNQGTDRAVQKNMLNTL